MMGSMLLLLLAGCSRTQSGSEVAPSASAAATVSASEPVPVPVPPTPSPRLSAAEVQAGKLLAEQGAGAVAACNSCHGARGEGRREGGFPRLAGLGVVYLRNQLEGYASGARQHPVMAPIAAALQASQRDNVAAYFATLPVPPAAVSLTPAPSNARAAKLALEGDEGRQLPACANCHGRDGSGLGDRLPPLAGQPASYLEGALAAWREGRRSTDPSGQMPRIAKALGSDDARSLAAWYAALPVPPSAASSPAAFVSRLPVVTSGPTERAGNALPSGAGTEQGAPHTGGDMGPGGGGATQQPGTPGGR